MTTQTYSKPNNMFSFYKKVITQNVSFPIVTVVLLLLSITLPNYNEISNYKPRNQINYGIYQGEEHMVLIIVMLTFLMGIVAVVINSYMHSKRKVDFYHALPITRGQMFTANTLAALTIVGLPFVIMSIASALFYQAFTPGFFQIDIMSVTLGSTGLILLHLICVYLFVSFISVNVTTVVETVLISGVLGFMPMIVYAIICGFMDSYVYGYRFDESYILFLSPFTVTFNYYMESSPTRKIISIIFTLVLIVVFYLLGTFFYKKRKSELAESRNNSTWPQIVSKIFVAFASTTLFFFVFEVEYDAIKIIPMLIFGFLFSIVAEIILSRGVKSIVKNVKWLLIGMALFLIMYGAVRLDIMGYENRMPALNKVESVTIDARTLKRFDKYYNDGYSYSYYNSKSGAKLTDPQAIEIVANSHKMIIDDHIEDKRESKYSGKYYNSYYSPMSIEYTLKNGATIKRYYSYDIPVEANENLMQLEANDNYIEQACLLFDITTEDKSLVKMEYFNGEQQETVKIDSAHMEELLIALRSDMLEESIESIKNPSDFNGYVVIDYNVKILRNKKDGSNGWDDYYYGGADKIKGYSVPLNSEYKNTLDLLSSLNYNDGQQKKKIISNVSIDSVSRGDFELGINVISNDQYSDSYFNSVFKTDKTKEINDIVAIASVQKYNSGDMLENSDLTRIKIKYDDGDALYMIIDQEELPEYIKKQYTRYELEARG